MAPFQECHTVHHEIPVLYNTEDAAQLLGLAPGSLNNMRAKGLGPTFVKLGSLVRYRDSDLVAWIESRARRSTDGSRRRNEAAYDNKG
jgi:predicted DNA-binding transcriptional regulator AlpA